MVRRTGAWPTPWKRVDEDVDPEEVEWCEVVDANDECVPFIGDLQYEVDQDQIVVVDAMLTAVNDYDRLRAIEAAARAVVGDWDRWADEPWNPDEPHWANFATAIDALRAAVEGTPNA